MEMLQTYFLLNIICTISIIYLACQENLISLFISNVLVVFIRCKILFLFGEYIMSGIYGVVSTSFIMEHEYINTCKWNAMYGDQSEERYLEDNIILGVIPEKLKNYDYGAENCILKYGNMTGVADCLIFSDVHKETSDEYFLHTTICRYGIDALKNINGDFAGAIWDGDKHELLLYRDHVGVRPLFYYQDDSRVIFSSDIRGITSISTIDASIDERWIYYSVTNIYSPSVTDTEYKNIKCVPPGGYMRFRFLDGSIETSSDRYWVPGEREIKLKNKEAYISELRSLVEDAVRIRANATNLPIGAELSGGLDSGVIDLLLAKMGKKCFYYSWSPGRDVLPYAKGDERIVIDDICEKAGIQCNYGGLRIRLGDHKQLRERTPLSFEEETGKFTYPFKYAFPCYVNTIQIYDTAAVMQENSVKFVFTGHSGDEGISHRSNPYELFYNHEYYRYLRLMFSRSSIYKHRLISTFKLIAENQSNAKNDLLKPTPYSEGGYSILNKTFIQELAPEGKLFLFPYDPRTYIRSGGIRNRLDILAFFSASTGVRYLIPYADYRVIDFALGIPRYLYHNWYVNRYIFREAFKDLLPDSLYHLREKQDHSYDNLPKDDEEKEISEEKLKNQNDEMIKVRKELLNMLSKERWMKYLDFDVLEKWANMKGNPEHEKAIMDAVCKCIQAEYMVNRSREVRND